MSIEGANDSPIDAFERSCDSCGREELLNAHDAYAVG